MLNNALFRIQELDRRTLSWWRTRRDRIDMDPSYQRRGRRWSKTDKQYLIDSIINGFDLPKLYFSDFTWGPSTLNDSANAYAVIDGKQRLEAIFDFFDGNFALSNNFVYIQDPSINIAGLTLQELRYKHPTIADDFENFNPIVMGVVTSEKRFIEELFVRLNRSRALTGAELRNAMPGPLPELFRTIGDHVFFTTNCKFPRGAGQTLNLAAKIFLFEINQEIDGTQKSDLDKLTVFASENVIPLNEITERIFRVLDEMAEIFVYEDFLLSSEGPIPVYYWLIRNNNNDTKWSIRDYLEDFQNWRESYKLGLELPSDLSMDLYVYESGLRSVNHKASHKSRYEILQKWFINWCDGYRYK